MQFDIEVTGADRVRAEIQKIPDEVRTGMVAALRRAVLRIHTAVVADELRGGSLKTRTGNLARAVFWRIETSAEQVIGRVGVDSAKAVYGRIQALGGTITPKRGRYLTIPVGEALTGNGVARFTARELLANPKAFGFRTAFINPRKTAIVGVRPDRSLEALFALKPSVTLPARNYLARGFARVRESVIDEFRQAVRTALKRG